MPHKKLFEALYESCDTGRINIRPLPSGKNEFFELGEDVSDCLKRHSGESLYFAVALRNGGATKEHITQIPAVWCDCDFKDISAEKLRKKVREFPFKPSAIVHSGGGVHLYWILKEPAEKSDIPTIENINKRIASAIGGDPKAFDASRILRIPGTVNRKPGRNNAVCQLKSLESFRYSIDDFDVLPELIEEKPKIKKVLKGVPKGERDDSLFKYACRLRSLNTDYSEAEVLILKAASECKPPMPEREAIKCLKSAWKKPEGKTISGSNPELPEIWIVKGKLPEMADAAEDALITAGYNLFQQGGDLKKITEIRSVNPQKIDFPESLKLISGVQPAYLKEALARVANWVKPVKIKANEKTKNDKFTSQPADPPRDVIEIFQARGEWKLPILSGIIHTPMLFADGTVLQKNGYDRKTGFYYHKTIDFSIPDKPTLADARKAMEILKYPLSEFPFVDADSQSVVLAGLLTALNRKAFDNAPMFAFNAPTPRTGKGQFCKYISLISTGEHAVLINVPNDRTGQEMEKRLSAALMANSPIWNIDNVSHPFGSDFLCSILTESFIHPRFLGKSENVKSPTNVVVLMTGNNLQIKGDLQGRTLICTIDSGVERPENRQFKLRISDYCLRNRKKLVEAGLTVLKAFRISKDKIDIPVWGSFEDWSEWIRKPLVWCGEADPWTANEKARQDDPEITGIKKLMQVWHNTYGNARITVKRLIEDSENNSDLREVIDEICVSQKQTEARQIGYLLRAYKGRIFNGMKFLPSDKSSKSKVSASWFVEKVEKHTLSKNDNDFDLLSIL